MGGDLQGPEELHQALSAQTHPAVNAPPTVQDQTGTQAPASYSICKREIGETSSSCPRRGSRRPRHYRPPMAATRTATGTRDTATSSGAAATTPTGVMAHSGSSASSCPSREAVVVITSGVRDMQA